MPVMKACSTGFIRGISGRGAVKRTGAAPAFRLRLEENKDAVSTFCFGGGSVSVFKTKEYSKDNPVMIVKFWDENEAVFSQTINVENVNPLNANNLEMIALSSFLDKEGYSENSILCFISCARGCSPVTQTEDRNSAASRKNFIVQVDEWRKNQYSTGNIAGFRCLSNYYNLLALRSKPLYEE
ncbi:MAG: hypothetical protein LBI42_11400 [Chitinispirillales bacterium]|jgi:hypothetical protein|nr:hypothetical protein [Chitinispirillales bacterium]